MKNENTFTKKNMLKIRENAETIKKIKVSRSKKVFQICDDKFFLFKICKISYNFKSI